MSIARYLLVCQSRLSILLNHPRIVLSKELNQDLQDKYMKPYPQLTSLAHLPPALKHYPKSASGGTGRRSQPQASQTCRQTLSQGYGSWVYRYIGAAGNASHQMWLWPLRTAAIKRDM